MSLCFSHQKIITVKFQCVCYNIVISILHVPFRCLLSLSILRCTSHRFSILPTNNTFRYNLGFPELVALLYLFICLWVEPHYSDSEFTRINHRFITHFHSPLVTYQLSFMPVSATKSEVISQQHNNKQTFSTWLIVSSYSLHHSDPESVSSVQWQNNPIFRIPTIVGCVILPMVRLIQFRAESKVMQTLLH